MGGDFNFVENPALDIKGGSTGHGASSRPVFKTLTETTNLVDNCRCFSPQGAETTFYSHPRNSHARLDRIYIDSQITNRIKSVSHPPFTISDHKAVLVTLKSSLPRGPGYWKYSLTLMY